MSLFLLRNTDTSTATDLIETLTPGHFGANFLVNQLPTGSDATGISNLTAGLQQISPGALRWPGGTVTETVFDFRNENATVMNGNQTITQDQFFSTAGLLHAEVTVTLQTKSAFGADHSAALALADGTYGQRQVDAQYLADMKAYVERTLADAAANGTHVHVFEIGNEFWGGAEMTATEYGRVARALLTTVNQAIDEALPAGVDRPEVAIQSLNAAGYMSPFQDAAVYVKDGLVDNQSHVGWTRYIIPGQGTAYQQAMQIADVITGKAEGGANLSGLVGGMIDHYYPKGGLASIDGDDEAFIFRQFNSLETRLGLVHGSLDRNITEWDPIRFVDANLDGVNDLAAANRGMPQAAMMVHMMYEMATHGVSSADVWPLYFAQANYTNMLGGATCDVRVPGAALSLMSQSLVGTRPLFDFTQNATGGQISVHGFSNAQTLVVMTDNQSDSAALATQLDLGSVVTATMKSQMDSGHYFITSTRLNAVDDAGKADTGITNFNVHPVLSYINGTMMAGHQVTLGDLAGWDLVCTEITIVNDGANLVTGRGGNDLINGYGGADTLVGGAGQDTLYGWTGNDNLQGGLGQDRLDGQTGSDSLYGGLDNDTLNGGTGNDVLTGGAGADCFVFTSGFAKDEVTDFNRSEGDMIDLSGMTGADDVKSFADVLARMHMVSGVLHIQFSTSDVMLDHVVSGQLMATDFIY